MKKSHVRLLVVLLILLIFPLISWYYLRSGLDYRMEAIAEFEEFGQFSWIDSYDERGRFVSEDRFDRKFIVAGIVPENQDDQKLFSSRFLGIMEQFSSRDEVLYLNIISVDIHDQEGIGQKLYSAYPGTNLNHLVVKFEEAEIDSMMGVWTSGMELSGRDKRDYLYLVDDRGRVVQYYNFYEDHRVARLVEHLSMQFTAKQNRRDYSDAIRQRL